jgi:hypothetical protein
MGQVSYFLLLIQSPSTSFDKIGFSSKMPTHGLSTFAEREGWNNTSTAPASVNPKLDLVQRTPIDKEQT